MWDGAETTSAPGGDGGSGSNEKQQCLERITTATSLSAFERCDARSFRRQLHSSFSFMLRLSKDVYSTKHSQICNPRKARRRHIFNIGDSSSGSGRCAPSIVQYDHMMIERCLDIGMNPNLMVLFDNHDSFIARRDGSLSQFTALEEIIASLLNPAIIPLACAGPVVQILVKAYVEDASLASSTAASNIENDRPHQTALKKALWSIVRRSPQLSVSRLIVPQIRGALKLNIPKQTSDAMNATLDETIAEKVIHMYNADAAGRCISLIQFILQTLPQARFEYCALSLLIEAVMAVDNADVLLMESRGSKRCINAIAAKKAKSSLQCSRCQMQSQMGGFLIDSSEDSQLRKRASKTASPSDLHDNDFDSDDVEEDGVIVISDSTETGTAVERISLSSRLRHCGNEQRVSMKRVMTLAPDGRSSDPDQECACLCYTDSVKEHVLSSRGPRSNKHARCTLLPIKMVCLRNELYRALLFVTKFQVHCKPLGVANIHRIDSKLFDKAISYMRKFPNCAAAKLSAVLIADVRGIENGFLPLFAKLLEYGRHLNAIRIYSELAVELAICDNPKVFWKVFSPLLDQALRANDESHDNEEYKLTILRGISYVFINRRRTLDAVDDSIVQAYITRLSLSFGCQSFWVNRAMFCEEKDEIIHALQGLGVLGIILQHDDGSGDYSCIDDNYLDSLSGNKFPFSAASSLRDAVGRMGPRVGCNRFLSSLDARLPLESPAEEDKVVKTIERRVRAESLSERAPILNYLDDDLLRHVFLYLSCRKLARVTGVCRLWRSLGNEPAQWQRLYQSRFKTRHTAEENATDWRKLFDAKWMAERRLRSSFSRCGKWKHRTCEYVGCLAVLRTRAMYEKHLNKHQSDAAKRFLKDAAAAARTRKRDEATLVKAAQGKRRKM